MSSSARQILFTIFLASLVYAVVRYHVFEAVPLADFPLYVFNKVLALSGFLLLIVVFGMGPARAMGAGISDQWLDARKDLGIFAFLILLAHAVCSMLIFGTQAYYAQFYRDSGALSAIGGWSMLFGVLSFTWLWIYNISFKMPSSADKPLRELVSAESTLILVGLLAAGHVAVMGFNGWLRPGNWAGNMPPISLVAFAAYLLGFVMRRLSRR